MNHGERAPLPTGLKGGEVLNDQPRHLGSSSRMIREAPLLLELPRQISRIVADLMSRTHHDTEELFIKSLLLYQAAVDAVEAGQTVAILDPDGEIDREITGF